MSNIRSRVRFTVCALIAAAAMPTAMAHMSTEVPRPTDDRRAAPRLHVAAVHLPMRFEQAGDRDHTGADFIARGPHYAVYVSRTRATVALASSAGAVTRRDAFSMRLVGAVQTGKAPSGLEMLDGVSNYLDGADPHRWRTGVRGYRKVEYRDVYRGVSLIYYGNEDQLEYDFVVAPGASADDIAIAFDDARGVAIDADGALAITTDRGTLHQPPPVVYQNDGDARLPVEGAFLIDEAKRVRFRIGAYDRRLPLVIDPVLTYSTFLGGTAGDASMAVAVDAAGCIYVAGETASLDFPRPNPHATPGNSGSLDAFVAKLNPAGDQLVYATYLGGSSYDYAKDIAVDASGNAYVTGSTASRNFPIFNARQPALSGVTDGFVTKLDAAGAIVYSTYLGGRGEDYAYGIAVDGAGRAHVTGQTLSPDFPTVGAMQAALGGGTGWKSANGAQSWSRLSSLKAAVVYAFAIDPLNPNIVYAGTESGVARSADGGQTWADGFTFPAQVHAIAIDPRSTSTVYAGVEGFVMRSRDSGTTWTPVGLFGSFVTSLAIDPASPATIYAGTMQSASSRGLSKSTDGGDHWTDIGFGTNVWSLALSNSSPSTIYAGSQGGVFTSINGGAAWTAVSTGPRSRVLALAVDPIDAAIVYAGADNGLFVTTSGGSQWTQIAGNQISSVVIPGNLRSTIYVGLVQGGIAVSTDSGATWTLRGPGAAVYTLAVDPVTPTTLYAGGGTQQDAFVARLSRDGSSLEYSTFLGGTGFDYGNAIAIDSGGNDYVVGATTSVDLPLSNPVQATFGGVRDLFVAKLSAAGALTYATYLGGAGWEDGGTIAVDAAGRAHVAGYTLSHNFPTAHAAQPAFGGGEADAFVAALDAAGSTLVYSTFLGGSGSEMGPGAYTIGRDPVVSIAVTPSGDAFVTGTTSSTDFPTLQSLQPGHRGGQFDAFVAKFSAAGELRWSTLLGGTAADFGKRVAVDTAANVVVAGFTSSIDFPTHGALQVGNAGFDDAFVTRIAEALPDSTPPTTTIGVSAVDGLAGWHRSPAVVTLLATDADGGSGVAYVDYRVNDAAFQRYASAFTIATEGVTQITARATDKAGNVETVLASAAIKIDTGSPVLAVVSPVERDYLHTEALTWSFSAQDDVSGLTGASPSAALDGSPVSNGQTMPLLALPLGLHTFVASASDVAGNASQRTVTIRVVATIQSLIAAVNVYTASGKLDQATQNSLLAKLYDAQAALDRGILVVVRNKLSEVIDVCSKRVAADAASVLIADAQYVLGTM